VSVLRRGFNPGRRVLVDPVVIGVGGAGCNIVARMQGRRFAGLRRVAADTDLDRLLKCRVPIRVHLGNGLLDNAEGDPKIGAWAARESKNDVLKAAGKARVVVLVAGLGGGTGSGAALAIAGMLDDGKRRLGAVVTTPFTFEGNVRSNRTRCALKALRGIASRVGVVPNQKTMRDPALMGVTDFFKAFRYVDGRVLDEVLRVLGRPKGR